MAKAGLRRNAAGAGIGEILRRRLDGGLDEGFGLVAVPIRGADKAPNLAALPVDQDAGGQPCHAELAHQGHVPIGKGFQVLAVELCKDLLGLFHRRIVHGNR